MKYFYKNSLLPDEGELLIKINSAAKSLNQKLGSLRINPLKISTYNKKYLETSLKDSVSTLQRYTFILSWALTNLEVSLEKLVFIDYGGGTGLLSLLAKELNIGTVIYNDIYDLSCKDAQIIAKSIGSEADHYIAGDIDELLMCIKTISIECHAVASYDVLEHIYDIEDFFKKISKLSNNPFNVLMASGANPYNPIIKRNIKKKHMEFEYKDRKKKWGHKERDSLRAYYKIRKDIISRYAESLSPRQVELLAKSTRGLIQAEIEICVENFLNQRKMPAYPDHPSNTCDPLTGNWAERLLDLKYLKKFLLNEGFKVNVKSGYYPDYSKNRIKRIMGIMINPIISSLKWNGLVFAPFFCILARKV